MAKKKQPSALALISGAARAPRLQNHRLLLPTALRETIAEFERALGGRQALIETLSVGETTPEVSQVLLRLADPKYDQKSLALVCQEENISPGQLFQAFQTAVLVRGQILSALAAAQQAPAVVKAILDEAIPHLAPCLVCDGVGKVTPEPTKATPNPEPGTCRTCRGKGEILTTGSYDHQVTALEIAGVLKKSGGVNVAVQTNVSPQASGVGTLGSLEQLQQAVSDLLYQPRATQPAAPIIDGEAVPVSVPVGLP